MLFPYTFIFSIKKGFFNNVFLILWLRSFLVKGTFPQYKPPEIHSLVSTKLAPEVLEKLKNVNTSAIQKNFMIENIKKNRSPEKKKRKKEFEQNGKYHFKSNNDYF